LGSEVLRPADDPPRNWVMTPSLLLYLTYIMPVLHMHLTVRSGFHVITQRFADQNSDPEASTQSEPSLEHQIQATFSTRDHWGGPLSSCCNFIW
jgi:hypothetical protein